MTYRSELIGFFVNFDDEQLSGEIIGVGHDDALIQINWQETRRWHDEFARGVPAKQRSPYPGSQSRTMTYDQINDLVTKEPKYRNPAIANSREPVKIQTIPSQSTTRIKPHQSAAMPVDGSSTALRKRSVSSQEIEIMAKCAVFDSENELIEIYESKKEAKAHNKGTDLVFVTAKDFPEDGIGQYATVEDLFPPKEEPVAEEGEKRTRGPVATLTGPYTVVKADAGRFSEEDPRFAIHKALVENDNFEDYLAATPESYEFTTSGGKVVVDTPKTFARYALRRGWIVQGDVQVEDSE